MTRFWLGLLTGGLLLLAGTVQAEQRRFVLIGDTPYSDYERHAFPHMMADINDEAPDFVIHVGDFKFGNV